MRWPAALVMATACAGGCRGAPPAVVDPWRVRVPPPATGEAAASLDSYYVPPAQTYPSQGPFPSPAPSVGPTTVYPPGSPTPAPANSGFTPNTSAPVGHGQMPAPTPGKGSPAGGSATRLASHSQAAPEDAGGQVPGPTASGVVQANHLAWTSATLSGNPPAESGEATSGAANADDGVKDIMDLPPVGSRQTARRPADDGAGAHYAYARDYGWLRGQLEYSPAGDEWKLRYVPIDGETDGFGGSVVLAGELPRSFRPGDFVVAQGFPDSNGTRRGFAPLYQLRGIEHQAE
jgi:hypothetical protein